MAVSGDWRRGRTFENIRKQIWKTANFSTLFKRNVSFFPMFAYASYFLESF